MNDAFAQLTSPIFQYVIDFEHCVRSGEQPEPKKVKKDLMELIDDAERRAASTRDLAASFALAKYALVYWADEMLITSQWSHSDAWRNQIIEWDYYHENLAGEKFFDKAAEAERAAGTDAIETFYLCVALGFQGRLAINEAELNRWAERAFGRIAAGRKQTERFLPEDPADLRLGPLQPLPGKSILLTVSVLTSATALITLICFLLAISFS